MVGRACGLPCLPASYSPRPESPGCLGPSPSPCHYPRALGEALRAALDHGALGTGTSHHDLQLILGLSLTLDGTPV